MVQAQNQENVELKNKVDDFIQNYLKSNRWADDDKRVVEAFEALKDEKSEFSDVFNKEYRFDFGYNGKEIAKLIKNGCALRIIGDKPLVDHLYDAAEMAFVYGSRSEFQLASLNVMLSAVLKHTDVKKILENSDIHKLVRVAEFGQNTEYKGIQELVMQCITTLTDNGKDLLKVVKLRNAKAPNNSSILDLVWRNGVLNQGDMRNENLLFTSLSKDLTREQMKDFLDKKIESEDKKENGYTKLGLFTSEFLKTIRSPSTDFGDILRQGKDTAYQSNAVLYMLCLGADRNIQNPEGKTFNDLAKESEQLKGLAELSDKINQVTDVLVKSFPGADRLYKEDSYRFKQDITLMLLNGRSYHTGTSKFNDLVQGIAANPGDVQNKKLLEDLSKNIMETSKDMIKSGMSDNLFYRTLQNIYNFFAAIYAVVTKGDIKEFALFTKGHTVLDSSKFKIAETTTSFRERIEQEMSKRNDLSSGAMKL